MSSNSKRESKKDGSKPNNANIKLPENWPEDVQYLTDHTYSQMAIAEQSNSKLSRGSSDDANWIKVPADLIIAPSPLVKICNITDEKHPACGQKGLFAAEHLQPDQFILLVSY